MLLSSVDIPGRKGETPIRSLSAGGRLTQIFQFRFIGITIERDPNEDKPLRMVTRVGRPKMGGELGDAKRLRRNAPSGGIIVPIRNDDRTLGSIKYGKI